MSLSFNATEARKGDRFSSIIRETGKYVGILTRAEKLVSKQGTEGVGLSFKADDGASASYLDVYTVKANGDKLWGASIIQSLMCCAGIKTADEGPITFDKWDKEVGEMVKATATGYPALMNARIGLVLQKELQSHYQTGADQERITIVGVFQASTGLTASEILDKVTKPAKLEQRMKALLPVRDNRKNKGMLKVVSEINPPASDFDDDIGDLRF